MLLDGRGKGHRLYRCGPHTDLSRRRRPGRIQCRIRFPGGVLQGRPGNELDEPDERRVPYARHEQGTQPNKGKRPPTATPGSMLPVHLRVRPAQADA